MTLNRQALQDLIARGAAAEVLAFFQNASEADRRSLAAFSEQQVNALWKVDDRIASQLAAAQLAVFATCSFSSIKALGWKIQAGDSQSMQVLADRRPGWLPEYAEHILASQPIQWITVRKLMKAGLIERPKHDNYVLGMTHHHAGVGSHHFDPSEFKSRNDNIWNPLTHLLADRDLLDDIWRLFELEGSGEYSLASHDKYSHVPVRRWDYALVELSRLGVLPRERLLDASLEALDRGFAQFRAGWFSSFHELLQPTVEERLARQNHYLRLLASPISPTVTFALQALAIVDAARPMDGRDFVTGLRPLMLARTRGTVKSALKLLDMIAQRDSAKQSLVAMLASEALAHEATDVQSAAFKLLAAHGSPGDQALFDAVTTRLDHVAASMRKTLQEWLQSRVGTLPTVPQTSVISNDATTDSDVAALEQRISKLPLEWRSLVCLDEALDALKSGRSHCAAIEFDGTEFPRLDGANAISPVNSLDDLIDLAARVIEHPVDADQIEQLLDGISRLCDQRPDDFALRTGPLLKRVRDLMKRQGLIPLTGHAPAADLVGLVLAWLSDNTGSSQFIQRWGKPALEYTLDGVTNSFPVPNLEEVGGAMSLRMQLLYDRVKARIVTATLCAPTHSGGWIDPIVLAQRATDPHILAHASDLEKVLSLLRLAPDGHQRALSHLRDGKDEFITALRYALGEPIGKFGPTDWLWVAAARSRSPFSDDLHVERAFPNLGPDAGITARPAVQVTKDNRDFCHLAISVGSLPPQIDLRLLTVLLWRQSDPYLGPEFVSDTEVAQLFQIRPLSQEGACARGAFVLAANLDWHEAQWHNHRYLQPLLDPDLPLKPMALQLLVLGLAAKEPGQHGLAIDAAIAAIDDGRLDGPKLGSALSSLLPTGMIKSTRWARTLQAVSQASPLHVEVVRDAIASCLRGSPQAMPKDLHALVELLKELVAESKSCVDTSARHFLEQVVGTTKLAKAAKSILAAAHEPEPERTMAIQRQIVERRLERVERWQSRLANRPTT